MVKWPSNSCVRLHTPHIIVSIRKRNVPRARLPSILDVLCEGKRNYFSRWKAKPKKTSCECLSSLSSTWNNWLSDGCWRAHGKYDDRRGKGFSRRSELYVQPKGACIIMKRLSDRSMCMSYANYVFESRLKVRLWNVWLYFHFAVIINSPMRKYRVGPGFIHVSKQLSPFCQKNYGEKYQHRSDPDLKQLFIVVKTRQASIGRVHYRSTLTKNKLFLIRRI